MRRLWVSSYMNGAPSRRSQGFSSRPDHGLVSQGDNGGAANTGVGQHALRPVRGGRIEWTSVKVAPRGQAAENLAMEKAPSHYYAARNTNPSGSHRQGRLRTTGAV